MPRAQIKKACRWWPTCHCDCPRCTEAKKKVTAAKDEHCQVHDNLCHVDCERI